MKVTVGAKELKKGKLVSPSPGGTRPPVQPVIVHIGCRNATEKDRAGVPFVSRILLEARHSARYEFWLVIDGMIVFIFTSCRQP
jgi:hypothetical protein